jgi:PAS domain S-box-containing protein
MNRLVPIPAGCDAPASIAECPEEEHKRANEALRGSEERFRMIADSCPSMMWATSAEGAFTFANKASREFFGMTHGKLAGPKRPRLVHPDEAPKFREEFDRAVGGRTTFRMEARFQRADGEWRLLGVSAEPMFSSGGKYLGHIGLCSDITECVRFEQERQFELSLLESIHAETLDGILAINQAGIIVSCNRRYLEIWGLDNSTAQRSLPLNMIGLEGRTLLLSVLERLEDPDSFVRRIQELYNHPDEKDRCEIRLKDGRTLERHSTGLKNSEGIYLGRVWFFRDITPHKQAEASLQRAIAMADEANQRLLAERSKLDNERNMLRALIDNVPDFMYVKDLESRFMVANAHVARVVGAKSPEELLGKTDFDFFPREEANAFYEDEQNVIRSGQPLYNREEKGTDIAGNEIDILTTKVPVRNNAGHVIGIAGIGRDISARKKMEGVLRNERRMLRALIDNVPDFMYVKDAEGRFVLANASLARLNGAKTPEEMLGKTDFDFYPREMASIFYEDEQKMMRSDLSLYNHEEINLDSIGNEVDVLTTKVLLRDSNGKVTGIAGVGRDISERKISENKLHEAEQKYRSIFDKAIVGIFQSAPDGRLLSVNPSMAFTCGYDSPGEMVASITDIISQFFADPQNGLEFMLIMDKIGGVKNYECETICKDGSKIWLFLNIIAIRQNGVVVRFEGMCQDITERKLLQQKLLQAYKLESVGQLAAGIAHEINTPTQYIGDNVRFLKDAFQDITKLLTNYERMLSAANDNTLSRKTIQDVAAAVKRADTGYLLEEIPKAIDQTLEGVTRVAAIVGAMKEFSHPDTKEKIPLDLNHAISSTITVARNEWKYVADLETEFDLSLPLVSCLPGEFNQVILNLIVNAAHTIADVVKKGGPAKGKIKVQTKNDADWVEIRIQDSGTGIPKTVQSRIFDPFFTTKEIGKGTGQGLAIARSVIVDKHGGSIHFETEEGKGTTFIIRLPLIGKALPIQAVAA